MAAGAHRPAPRRVCTAAKASAPTPAAPTYSTILAVTGSRGRVIPACLPSARTARSNGSHRPRTSLAQLSARASNGAPSPAASALTPASTSRSERARPVSAGADAGMSHHSWPGPRSVMAR